jgi:hypothetical protein
MTQEDVHKANDMLAAVQQPRDQALNAVVSLQAERNMLARRLADRDRRILELEELLQAKEPDAPAQH